MDQGKAVKPGMLEMNIKRGETEFEVVYGHTIESLELRITMPRSTELITGRDAVALIKRLHAFVEAAIGGGPRQ